MMVMSVVMTVVMALFTLLIFFFVFFLLVILSVAQKRVEFLVLQIRVAFPFRVARQSALQIDSTRWRNARTGNFPDGTRLDVLTVGEVALLHVMRTPRANVVIVARIQVFSRLLVALLHGERHSTSENNITPGTWFCYPTQKRATPSPTPLDPLWEAGGRECSCLCRLDRRRNTLESNALSVLRRFYSCKRAESEIVLDYCLVNTVDLRRLCFL